MTLEKIVELAKKGQGSEALEQLKEFVKESPNDVQALFMLASWSFQSMNWQDAEYYMERLVNSEPNNLNFLTNIVGMYMKMSNYKKAIKYQVQIVGINPENLENRYNLGMLYHRIFDFDNALKEFNFVHEQAPNNTQVLGVIADMTHGSGDFEEAKLYYKKILQIDPFSDAAINGIVKSSKYSLESEEILTYASKLLDSSKVKKESKAQVYLSLAKMYDDCKLYDEAWKNYCLGNEIMVKLYPFDAASLQNQIKQIKAVFNAPFFNDSTKIGDVEHSPIFIVGMPRSGTTLLEQILEHSGETCAGGESIALNAAINREFYNIRYPDELNKADSDIYLKLADDYLTFFKNCHLDGDKTPLDKLPGNFLHLGLIKKIFPNVKIINLTREKDDCTLSIFFQMFAKHMSFTTDLKSIGEFYDIYLDIMRYWNSLFPENILNINYEDLVSDFESNTKKIYSFLNIEWNESVGNFVNSKNSVQTPSSWQVRQGVNTKSIGRSANYRKFLNKS